MGYTRNLEELCSVLDSWPADDADDLPKLPYGMEWKKLTLISGDQYIVSFGSIGLYISGKEWFAKKYGRKGRVVEDMKQQFTVTPDGNMTCHGDKPIHVGVGVIFNPGDTLVRASEDIKITSFGAVEDKLELCGANESLVNQDAESPEWVDGLPLVVCRVEVHNDDGYALLYGHNIVGCRGEVKAVYESGDVVVVVVEVDGYGYCFRSEMIRPIKTPREKSAEKIMDIIASVTDPQECVENAINRIAEAIYESNCRIQEIGDD